MMCSNNKDDDNGKKKFEYYDHEFLWIFSGGQLLTNRGLWYFTPTLGKYSAISISREYTVN